MVTSGLLLKGSAVRVVTISGTKENHHLVAERFHKLELPKNPTKEDVEVFVHAFKAHCTDNGVDIICINKRNETGDRSGGAASFRIEGIILATSQVPIKMIHSGTIAATDRREAARKNKRPNTVDLGKAYDLAFEGLE
jgi:hypothetical protein